MIGCRKKQRLVLIKKQCNDLEHYSNETKLMEAHLPAKIRINMSQKFAFCKTYSQKRCLFMLILLVFIQVSC
jgi:hypothetical protein